MPRLSSQHSPMQHQPLRGADTPRRRRQPTGPRALTLLAGGEWRHVHGVRLPAGLRERGGRRSILRRDGHPIQVHWINGWPSIWTRLSVSKTFAVGDPEVGSTLAIGFRNTGVAGSTAAFDLVSLTSHGAESPPSPPPSPPPPFALPRYHDGLTTARGLAAACLRRWRRRRHWRHRRWRRRRSRCRCSD